MEQARSRGSQTALSDRERRINEWSRRISYYMSRFLRLVSRHWLSGVNLFMGLYVGLPFLAPILHHLGHAGPANVIHTLFRPFCHQRPERSFFLFGERAFYPYDELARLLGTEGVPPRYVGAPGIGFKVAICERDVAIYGMMLLAGLAFHLVRRRLTPLRIRQFVLLTVPMAVDGLGQLLGLWVSSPWSRLVTGSLFGLACVWLTYPYLQQGMAEVHETMRTALTTWNADHARSDAR